MEDRVKQYRTDSDGGHLQWNVETLTLHLDPDGSIGFGSLGIPSPDPWDGYQKPAMDGYLLQRLANCRHGLARCYQFTGPACRTLVLLCFASRRLKDQTPH